MCRIRETLVRLAPWAGIGTPALIIGIAAITILTPGGVAFASPEAVILDCRLDGKLDHRYSLSDLKKAEKRLPADIDEYTTCRDLINQAEVAASDSHRHSSGAGAGGAGGTHGGGSTGGSAPPNPRDAHALARATHAGGAPPALPLEGTRVVPGSGGLFPTAGAARTIPVSLLLALIAVAVLTAVGGFVTVRRRCPELIGTAVRIFRR